MKLKRYFVLAGVIFLLLASAGCGGIPGGSLPTCPAASLQAPILTSPVNWSVADSLLPSLTWSYPDTTCIPQGYVIHLSIGPFFTNDIGGNIGNASTSWTPGYPLALGEEFAWGVQAVNGTTLGPYAGNNYFFTGPMCATAALIAPYLLQPANGAVITELDPSLIWVYPDACLPQGYRVDLSTDATFADTSLSGGTGNPSTRWGPGDPLADCTVYFWKIAPINDTTLGPATGVFSFTTNVSGTCPTPTPVPPTPTPTPVVPTPTPTLASFVFIPNINANCHSGPDPVFDSIDVVMKGKSYRMDGRNLANTWYRIMLSESVGCWVQASAGTPSRDTSDLRVLIEPPTPTPTLVPSLVPSDTPTLVVNCSSYIDAISCNAQPACVWIPALTHPGDCVNK
jgi:hypothetical protein